LARTEDEPGERPIRLPPSSASRRGEEFYVIFMI
jgi:hypothetical protein